MPAADLEHLLSAIAAKHLALIVKYNPYRNFPGVTNRDEFRNLLSSDPAFSHLGLADDRYIIARVGGNWVTSLHRKIGDMYEEMFKILIQTKFEIPVADLSFDVDVKIGDRVQRRSTDGIIKKSYLRAQGVKASSLVKKATVNWRTAKGLGFEVRSCYQIGDSKRIQADYDMALALEAIGYVPIMLVFCATSLKSPTARLSKSWNLYKGQDAFAFVHELVGFDLYAFMVANSARFRPSIHDVLEKL